MKTSNKILLTTFLLGLLIIVSVHVTLYAKYKRGDYTLVTEDLWLPNMITQSLGDVKYISVANVQNLFIHPSDSNKLRYEKPGNDARNMLEITRRADTLFLSVKNKNGKKAKWYGGADLALAGALPIRVFNSNLRVQSSAKSTHPVSLDITLDSSFLEVNNTWSPELNFTGLKIDASNGSRISFLKTKTNFLNLRLRRSSFDEDAFTADSINVTTDITSKLRLSGKNLVKAKIVSYE